MRLIKEPIYQQLAAELRRMAGRLGPDCRFPTEREIAERFAVSRATANKAVSALVSEGVLELRKGIGTFVRPPRVPAAPTPLTYDLRSLVSFTDRARAAGKTPSTRVLQFSRHAAAVAPAAVTTALAVLPTDELVHVERVRLADDQPVILEDRWLVGALVPRVTRELCAASLYSMLVDHYRLTLVGARQSLSAVAVSRGEARHLDLQPSDPALCVTATGLVRAAHGLERPIWWERTLYRSDRYDFTARLSGIDGTGAVGRFVG